MPRVACLMMLRDEVLLAELWLRHHGDLFGFENLYVYDNGSVSEPVLATLRQFAARGVNVDFRHNRPEDFGDKGNIIGEKIREFQRRGLYDIALPLDCDEFVAVTGPAGPSIDRNDIMTELTRIHAAGAICRIDHHFYNVPGYLDIFWHTWQQKSVIPVAKFTSIDHGFTSPSCRRTKTSGPPASPISICTANPLRWFRRARGRSWRPIPTLQIVRD